MTRRLNFDYHAGDTRGIAMQLFDSNGAIDLSSIDDIRFGIYDFDHPTTQRLLKTKKASGITVTVAAQGRITVDLTKADTVDLKGFYLYEVRLADTTTSENAVLRGRLKIHRSLLK